MKTNEPGITVIHGWADGETQYRLLRDSEWREREEAREFLIEQKIEGSWVVQEHTPTYQFYLLAKEINRLNDKGLERRGRED